MSEASAIVRGVSLDACRLCRHTTLASLPPVRDCPMMACAACGLVQVGLRFSKEDIHSFYGAGYFKDLKYGLDGAAVREQARRLRWLDRAGLPQGGRVLDVGCATGDFLITGRDAYEMWGVDHAEYAVQVARTRAAEARDRIFCGGVDAVPVPDGYFDAVTLWDTIEHLDDPVQVVRSAVRKLKTDGILALSTPNIGGWIARCMGRRWAFMTPPEHLVLFSHRTLVRLLQNCGLDECGWVTLGKSINLGFLIYKARRVFPEFVPQTLVDRLSKARMGRAVVYLPTGDIQYAMARKRA